MGRPRLILPGRTQICVVSLRKEEGHVRVGNKSRLKLDMAGIGVEAISKRDHSDSGLGSLSTVSVVRKETRTRTMFTDNQNKAPKMTIGRRVTKTSLKSLCMESACKRRSI